MPGAFDIGVSALLASQRQLSTTSHNIANINTEGYSRQKVALEQRPPQFVGVGFLGKGVDVSTITRSVSDFLNVQLRNNAAGEARSAIFGKLTDQVDALISDGTFGAALERYFSSLQDVNNDPSSTPAREVFLTTAKTLTDRFQDLDTRFSVLNENVNREIAQRVTQVNSYTAALASLNRDIVQAFGVSQGQPPNDLLDQRDRLLQEMSRTVNISTLEQTDGAVNVFIGNGQLLVAGGTSIPLVATPNPLDGGRTEVSLGSGGVTSVISDAFTNGELAGILAFRDELLDPSRNSIGRLAAAFSITMNAQHRAGLDLQGALGGNLFALGSATVNAAVGNTGTLTMALDPNALSSLTDSDYQLVHNGSNFILTRLTDGTQQSLIGAGPFAVEGVTLTLGSAPAAGDQYLLQPSRYLARGMTTQITDPLKIALANPVKSSAALTNIGSAQIGVPQILDATQVSLLTPVQIVFANPPSSFQINGVGPLIPYTSGANIDLNGWRIQLTGPSNAGDTFRVDPNTNGRGDNRNGLALSTLRTTEILVGGTASYQDGYSQLIGRVGSRAQQAQISRDALKVQRENAEAARDAVSAVNLDEEAANLIRFQQAFQAAAQIIQVTNETFNALLQAVRS